MIIVLCVSVLFVSLVLRILSEKQPGKIQENAIDGMAQTTGNKEIQADVIGLSITTAGKMAVMADGIGKENIGKVCANLAVEEFVEAFSLALH